MKLSISYPLNYPVIIQKFGNIDPVYTSEGMLGHNGIDFKATFGEPIFACHDGWASFQIDSQGGHGVVVITNQEFDDVTNPGQQTYYKTIYWHMVDGLAYPQYQSPIADKTGFVPVKSGDLIGYADNTGISTGTHLHFGMKTVAQGETWGSWYNTNQNNGYFGAIDPQPFFNEETPIQIQADSLISKGGMLAIIGKFLKSFFS